MDSQFITNIIFCAIISVSVYLTIIIVLLHYTYTKIYEKNIISKLKMKNRICVNRPILKISYVSPLIR